MPETIRQKMIKEGRLRPDGFNWHGQPVFFNMFRSGKEWPEGMTPEEENQFISEEFPNASN